MPVEEHRRIQLFERLASVLGQEHAVTMLEMLPPAGQDVLTREDLQRALAPYATKADVDRLERALVAAQDELNRTLGATKDELNRTLDATKDELNRTLDATKDELNRTLGVTKDDLNGTLSHYATKADIYRIFTAQTIALAALLGTAAVFFG